MSQKGKQWLYKNNNSGYPFPINREDGGIVSSLIRLGYLSRKNSNYQITPKGEEWIKGALK